MGPSRKACDRCHGMKTRCVRAPQSSACLRCTRRHIACQYSLPNRAGRPPKAGRRPRAVTGEIQPRADIESSTIKLQEPVFYENTLVTPAYTPPSQMDDLDRFFQDHADSLIGLDEIDLFSAQSSSQEALSPCLSESVNLTSTHGSTTPSLSPTSEPVIFGFQNNDFLFNPETCSHTRGQSVSIRNASETKTNQHQKSDLVGEHSLSSLERLIDLQDNLLRISRAAPTGHQTGNGTEQQLSFEGLYHSTETLITILNNFGAQEQDPERPHTDTAIVLLVWSCYTSIVAAFEHHVSCLRPQTEKNKTEEAGTVSGLSRRSNDSHNETPPLSISVGGICINNLPRQMVADINVNVMSWTVQHLRESIGRWFASSRSGKMMKHQQESLGSSQDDVQVSITDFAGQALLHLGRRAHSLAKAGMEPGEDNFRNRQGGEGRTAPFQC